jgi:RNA polymerase sigma-70 factor (ECF subfamily)
MTGLAMEGIVDREPLDPQRVWRDAWEAEREALYGFLRRQVRDGDAAEDLLQETFVRAIRSGRIEERGRLRSYLFTIAQNLATDHWRRHLRLAPMRGELPEGESVEQAADGRSESPEAEAGRRGLEQRLRTALAELPERYRTAFRLAAIEQHSYREIAEATGWSLDQVRINVHRARKRLIDRLGDAPVTERTS